MSMSPQDAAEDPREVARRMVGGKGGQPRDDLFSPDRPVPAARETYDDDATHVCPECGTQYTCAGRCGYVHCAQPERVSIPAAREIPEEMVEAAHREYLAAHHPDLPADMRAALIAALKLAPASFLARLLVEALGGEEAVVERMARGMWAAEFEKSPEELRAEPPTDEDPDPGWWVDDNWEATLDSARDAWRSLMEDTPE